MLLDFAWIEATGLAAVRTTAFVFTAPPFSYGAFPARIKAMVAIGVALALSGTVAPGSTMSACCAAWPTLARLPRSCRTPRGWW